MEEPYDFNFLSSSSYRKNDSLFDKKTCQTSGSSYYQCASLPFQWFTYDKPMQWAELITTSNLKVFYWFAIIKSFERRQEIQTSMLSLNKA